MINYEKLIDRLPNDAINKLKKAMYRCVDLIEMFFPDPNDSSRKIVLDSFQRDFVDTIQYGFPLSQFKFGEIDRPVDGVIFISRRKIGKTMLCGNAAAALMILGPQSTGKPPCHCGCVAASEEEAFILIDKVKYNIENSDFNEFISGAVRKDYIRLQNGSFTKAHAASPKSIRGPGYHVLFIDETAQMEEKLLFAAALPLVEHGERWVMITTPQGSKGKIIEYYETSVKGRPVICKNCGKKYEQKSFINTKFPIRNEIWVMPALPNCSCGANSYKYGIGLFATPYLDPWRTTVISQDKLKRTLDAHGWSPWARQEWLGEILDEASMVILKEWIIKNTVPELRNIMQLDPNRRYVVSTDYGRLHDAACICVTSRIKKNPKIRLDYMRTVSGEHDFDTDFEKIQDNLEQVIRYYKPVWWIPDATGTGYSEVEKVNKLIRSWSRNTKIYNNHKNSARVPNEQKRLGFWIEKSTKPELIGRMITLLSANPPALEIPSQTEPEIEEFTNELLKFECEVKEGGYVKYGTQAYHDDRVIAFALGLMGNTKQSNFAIKPKGLKHINYNRIDDAIEFSKRTINVQVL